MTMPTLTQASAEDRQLARVARRFAAAIEPVAAQVFFAPECHNAYADLGFDPSPSVDEFGVAAPDPVAYLYSRGSALGNCAPAAVASIFGVFEPDGLTRAWCTGRARVHPSLIAETRTTGSLQQLERILGAAPDGLPDATSLLEHAVASLPTASSPMSASLRDREPADHPMGRMWQLTEVIREFRGEKHVATWVAAGLAAPEILLLTERYWGLDQFAYAPSRGWDIGVLRDAADSLRSRGLLNTDGLTCTGSRIRDQIEVATDRHMRPAIDALGSSIAPLITILRGWGNKIKNHGGYLRVGPHELAPRSPL